MSYPRCFNSQKAYDAWVYYADRSQASPNWPCIDCSEVYQQRMVAAKRCQHPDAIPGKSRPCPVSSAEERPEASSGKPPLAKASPESSIDSARVVAKSSIKTTAKYRPKAPAGARSYP